LGKTKVNELIASLNSLFLLDRLKILRDTEFFMEVFLKSQIKSDIMCLYFSVPPEWVIEPKDTSVVAGHTVALHCQADGFPLPTVIWRKGHGKYYCTTTVTVTCLAVASIWCPVNLLPNLEDHENFQANPSSIQITDCSCNI
jgi:hypothetical protein